MAFQDFDLISQRREQQRRQKIQRRLMIAASVTVSVLLIAGAAVGVIMYQNNQDATNSKVKGDDKEEKTVNAEEKAVKTVCAKTDYQKTCQGSLQKAVKGSGGASLLEIILKSAFSDASDEIDKAIKQVVKSLKPDNDLKKAALQDCVELLNDAKEELDASIIRVKGKGPIRLAAAKPELQNWLSAVMSYQQTCIDGFPDGEEKSEMQKLLKTAKEHSSNALAIGSQVSSSLPKSQDASSSQRKLLMDPAESRRMLKADSKKLTPNMTVAKDGSGNFTTINEALKAIPENYTGRYVIYMKEGVYAENVNITKKMENVTLFGDGSQKSIVTGSKSFADGVTVLQTATFVVLGEGFMAQSIGFRNTAGPDKKQAVALRVQADLAMFINCRMEGYQAPLFAQAHRQFYRSCYITGTVDIIFGDAAAVFQNCMIYIRKGSAAAAEVANNTVTAQGRVDKRETTGFVLQNCRILADKELEPEKDKVKSYLGRTMKAYSRTVVMESEISDVIQPEGWVETDPKLTKTIYFAEYKNEGARAETSSRVNWEGFKKSIGEDEAKGFTVGPFLQGETWLKDADVPVRFGMFH